MSSMKKNYYEDFFENKLMNKCSIKVVHPITTGTPFHDQKQVDNVAYTTLHVVNLLFYLCNSY